ncbi:hypothetical protein [Acetobacter sicerae]|uniref:hypothetical protein n=1 Tax=Acetobacter sicerae TaxID=85325 RepID=UPI00156B136B|nr:hypothetical protein [Acetobacter sicerae]NHN93908.1 hypothetical protein [Acetobacter sicerae]
MTENSTNPRNGVVRSGMTHETWPHCLSENTRAGVNPEPRDWNVACAMAQVRMGVPLTEVQRALVEKTTAARSQ